MSFIAKGFVFVSGLAFAILIVMLLLKRRINEKNSIIWLIAAAAILLVSANPGMLDWAATRLGITYPPSLLFLFSNLVLLLLVLHQSMQISSLHEKLKQLAQHISIAEQEDRERSEKEGEV